MGIVHIVAFLVVFSLALYIILDGPDLGTGIILPFVPQERQTPMIKSIIPFWDGNEIWLIYATGLLFVAFPTIYWTAITALYIPLLLMLFFFVLRGVSFEAIFKVKYDKKKTLWIGIFSFSSVGVGFTQGVMLATVIFGINITDDPFAFSNDNFLRPVNIISGVVTTIAYAIFGTTWQMYKMEKSFYLGLHKIFQNLLVVVGITSILVSPVIYNQRPDVAIFILEHKIRLISIIVLYIVNIGIFCVLFTQKFQHRILHFLISITLFIIALVIIVIMMYPYAIAFSHGVYNAPNVAQVDKLVIIVALCTFPVMFLYTWYVHYALKCKSSYKLFDTQ